ncbi:PAS domain S-box protein [Desulfobacter curvatus]|uniref:PAS domain S-box protein n=1 Tax=Desulfobacter curvatus TaxID=2290 RepID=UPI00037B1690|nr:PAS domain S-box protein [Desulfobacter curvatus]
MTIKNKILISGTLFFLIFATLALMSVRLHREVSFNLDARDKVNRNLIDIQSSIKWKNHIIGLIENIVAQEHVPPPAKEQFRLPADRYLSKHKILAESGLRLVDLISLKEQASADTDQAFRQIRDKINRLYHQLDKKMTTMLAVLQSDYVPGDKVSEKSTLAPYVLKSINQLTVVALNALISKQFSNDAKSIVKKNQQFISSQIQWIDSDGSISGLFSELFIQLTSLERLIVESNKTLCHIDQQILEAKSNFDLTAREIEVETGVATVTLQRSSANKNLKDASRFNLIATILFLFIVPLLVIALGISGLNTVILAPINHLINAMKGIEDGNFDVIVPIRADDEIGKLAWAFNAMAAKIKTKVVEMSRQVEMEASMRLSQFIIDKAPIGIWRTGNNGEIIDVNEQGCQSLGYSRDELCHMTVYDFDPHAKTDSLKEALDMLRETGTTFHESQHQRKDGRIFPIQVTSRMMTFEDQEFSVAFVQDVTRQKEDEKELTRLRNFLINIINSMPSILVAVDRDGKITQWNNRTEQITGVAFEDAYARPLGKVFPELAGEMNRIMTAIRERRVISTPKVSSNTGREGRFEDLTIYPLVAANGVVDGAVIRIDDVTDQVRLEEMMVQSEKMLSVGGLAAGMAHEINNPLAGIIQTANVMKSRLGNLEMQANLKIADETGISVDQIRSFMQKRGILRMLDAINESGLRVAEIVNNMLSFSRKSNADFSSHHPAQLMDRTLELAGTDYDMKKQYDFKTIKIIKEYENNLPMIDCEGVKIQQVLLNILRNGSQAMQSQGMGSGYTPCFILRIAKEEKMLRIEIEDNGPGMDKDTQSKIFEPFFTTKPIGSGTGLGLSVSYFIITQNHGGTMDVASSLGKGSRFIIRLPLEQIEQ